MANANPYAFTSNPYTLKDVGCYYNHTRGPDGILANAGHHGMTEPTSVLACNAYMNEHFPVEGARWGRNDSGDWGLWAECEHRWKESVYCGLPGDGEMLLACRTCGTTKYVPWPSA